MLGAAITGKGPEPQDFAGMLFEKCEVGSGPITLRWACLHVIAEYARHNGHADLLRETVDGATGW